MTRFALARTSNASFPAKISAILSDTASISSQVARSAFVSGLPGNCCGVALALPRETTAFGRPKSVSNVDRSITLSGLRGVISPIPRIVRTTVSSVARSMPSISSRVGIFLKSSASESTPSLFSPEAVI